MYGHRDVAEARRDVEFAEKVLALEPRHRILDLCCGNGRHLAALGEKGYRRLAGVDLSRALLKLAREAVAPSGGPAGVLQADMRHLPFQDCFDAVLNLFTSFGYFEKDGENRLVLESMRDALQPGGRFLLDYLNPEQVTRNLQPRTERTTAGRRVIETRSLDLERHRVNKHIAIHTPAGVKHYEESVRLYSREEMLERFAASGLEVTATYGDFDARPLDPDAPRMIFAGRRV